MICVYIVPIHVEVHLYVQLMPCPIVVIVIISVVVIAAVSIVVDCNGREARLYFGLPSEEKRIRKGLQLYFQF